MMLRNKGSIHFLKVFKLSGFGRVTSHFSRRSLSTEKPKIASHGKSGGVGLYFGGGLLFGLGLALGAYSKSLENDKTTALSESGSLKESLDDSVTSLELVAPPTYAGPEEFNEALEQIRKVLGPDSVSTDKDNIKSVSDSFFSTHHPPEPETQHPLVVVSPSSTEEVSQIMKIAHKYRVPVIASSGLTSLEGHTMHTRGPYSISLSFADMDNIIAVHPEDLDAVVQPGVDWQGLDGELLSNDATKHLMFGPDPGIGARIGGMIGTSCSGTNAYRYGTMKENIVNVTVVLADGTIVKTRQRPRKSSAGYDLTRLFVGAEGTLGIVTEATIKLHVRPKYESVCIASFPTIADATSTALHIIKDGLQLNAMELLNATTVSFVNRFGGVTDKDGNHKQFDERPTLLFKAGGTSKEGIQEQLDLIRKISAEHGNLSIEQSNNEEENGILWSARRNGLWSTYDYGSEILDDPNDVQIWTTDIAVPISHLTDVIAETDKDMSSLGFLNRYALMGHIGDGNCHFLIVYNSKDYAKVQNAVDRMVYRALKFEGTCTGEHGVGVGKRRYLDTEIGPNAVALMRKIKLLLDPRRILNPDKVFRIDLTDDLDQKLSHSLIKETGKHCC